MTTGSLKSRLPRLVPLQPRPVLSRGFCTVVLLILLLAGLKALEAQVAGAGLLNWPKRTNIPPRAAQARRFLAQRGWVASARRGTTRSSPRPVGSAEVQPGSPSSVVWQPMGPVAVQTSSYGLVTGRVSALAFDPADSTGNRLYVGTTGGGVWAAQNAGSSNPANIVFSPLTDAVGAFSTALEASISIGALTVQPGGTGVVLAGTGDPNDALDSYYGAGILRSTDNGGSWSLIRSTADKIWNFAGEGFAGFAWSTANPQLVVAAVSQAYEGMLVNADIPRTSYQGLYYSTDAGATWNLARISDGSGSDVQGPATRFADPDGNAATSVVWNPVRQLFIAAVRFHGYYQSSDGMTWTRISSQPGTGLTTRMCPTNAGAIGSTACPIFRGTLAVNPQTGDTFAWTVDIDNQDVGLWQDQCGLSAGQCGNSSLSFGKQWDTSVLESNTDQGSATIADGDYTLALAATPSNQDTILLAGANDLWRCSLAMGCSWRNATNADSCMSAQVAGYQHALAWNAANPLEIMLGNDGGIWRSMDAIGESGQPCDASDATHFQNLNGSVGSLAEVADLAQAADTPYAVMAGLGANGTAGVKLSAAATSAWPMILSGEGGTVAVSPVDDSNWYANNAAGVSIRRCHQAAICTPADFGSTPTVNMNVPGADGIGMVSPAPFLVDPVDPSLLLVGTCRVWRVSATGEAWNASNAISPILDDPTASGPCSGDALIRSMAAMKLVSGGEVVYVGTYGAANGSASLAGHVFSAVLDASGSVTQGWQDLTLNSVTNNAAAMNVYGMDVSSIFVDPHDSGGNTVYVTLAGFRSTTEPVQPVYRSTDGGAHWTCLTANLPSAPANSIAVDPQDANTVYVATDSGVYSTRRIASCSVASSACWAAYGSALPQSPVVQLIAAPATSSAAVLTAATYGRGVWQAPLWTAGEILTSATAAPASLTFATQAIGAPSDSQRVTVTNSGSAALLPTAITATGDFGQSGNCLNAIVPPGSSCTINISFTPTATGPRTGQLTLYANVAGGQLALALSGTGSSAGTITLTPVTVDFGSVALGSTSAALQVTAQNKGGADVSYTSNITGPFAIASNPCGTSVSAGSACQLTVTFTPAQEGMASGALTFTDSVGTQAVALSGTGATPPTDSLSVSSLAFPDTIDGLLSAAQVVTLTNSGDLPLTSIAVSVSGSFQTSSNCGTQLAGRSSCAISVLFAPIRPGTQTGTLTIVDAVHTQTVPLSGTGLQPPVLSVNPTSLSFPAQQAMQASPAQTLMVSNSGGAPMANVGFQFMGPSAASFSTGATCGVTLTSGSTCSVPVIFKPAATGGNTATLVVSSSTLGVTPVSVPLNGIGTTTAGLMVSPAQFVFPATIAGQSSVALSVTVTDLGSVDAGSLSLQISDSFSVTQNTCGADLVAGSSCTLSVVFSPQTSGAFSGALQIQPSAFKIGAVVALSGTSGTAAGIQISPASVTFPTTSVGQTSAVTTVTVTNTGTLGNVSNLALAASAGFQLTNSTCGSALAAQASCAVGVAFMPTAAGPQTGTMTATTGATSASATATLTGTGYDFTLAASGSTSQSVVAGQTASFLLVVTPLGGVPGSFSYTCGTPPANMTCSFNPGSLSLGAGVTGNVTVQIAVAQSAGMGTKPKPGRPFAPLALAVVLLPLVFRRTRRSVLPVVLLGLAALALSSCSGSGFNRSTGSSGGSSGAPGSIPVTVTSGNIQHSISLTVTVE